jgi:hypothetical protein
MDFCAGYQLARARADEAAAFPAAAPRLLVKGSGLLRREATALQGAPFM